MYDHGIHARGILQQALIFSLDYPGRRHPDARYFENTTSVPVREEVSNL
jgi:hypothetical protein